ncbi:MAG: hypothetical protein K2N75_03580 [Helicobacter sp.]|uniref:hypothetical protein n=1 Tax=Helicobacter sp. TaxID=218 RepID=UPI0023D0AEB2|nr:hypothetical protein [Helicobacter sp.]MDE5926054.1 hypothetical protein [Helicobacter sp.]MDE7175118.1 hypothetical protein [Helicobacter sp.]
MQTLAILQSCTACASPLRPYEDSPLVFASIAKQSIVLQNLTFVMESLKQFNIIDCHDSKIPQGQIPRQYCNTKES